MIEVPVSALTDPMALVTVRSAARLAAGPPRGLPNHELTDREMSAADTLLRALDSTDTADPVATLALATLQSQRERGLARLQPRADGIAAPADMVQDATGGRRPGCGGRR